MPVPLHVPLHHGGKVPQEEEQSVLVKQIETRTRNRDNGPQTGNHFRSDLKITPKETLVFPINPFQIKTGNLFKLRLKGNLENEINF